MRVLKLTVMAALLVLGTAVAQAEQTNLVENIRLRLIGLRQGGTTTNRNEVVTSVNAVFLETRQVIQILGTAMGTSFPANSRLVLVTPLNGDPLKVEVRRGDLKEDVTDFFVLEQTGAGVGSSVLNRRNGRSTQTLYSIQRFALQDSSQYPALTTRFDVSGFAIDFSANRPVPGPDNYLRIDAAGNGDRNGVPLVINGSIEISGQTIEVVEDEWNGTS